MFHFYSISAVIFSLRLYEHLSLWTRQKSPRGCRLGKRLSGFPPSSYWAHSGKPPFSCLLFRGQCQVGYTLGTSFQVSLQHPHLSQLQRQGDSPKNPVLTSEPSAGSCTLPAPAPGVSYFPSVIRTASAVWTKWLQRC